MEDFQDTRLQEFKEEYSYFDNERIERLYNIIRKKNRLTFSYLSLESPDSWLMHIVRHSSQFDCPEEKGRKIEIVQYFLIFCDEIKNAYLIKNHDNEIEEFKKWFEELTEEDSLFNDDLECLIVESEEKDTKEILNIFFD